MGTTFVDDEKVDQLYRAFPRWDDGRNASTAVSLGKTGLGTLRDLPPRLKGATVLIALRVAEGSAEGMKGEKCDALRREIREMRNRLKIPETTLPVAAPATGQLTEEQQEWFWILVGNRESKAISDSVDAASALEANIRVQIAPRVPPRSLLKSAADLLLEYGYCQEDTERLDDTVTRIEVALNIKEVDRPVEETEELSPEFLIKERRTAIIERIERLEESEERLQGAIAEIFELVTAQKIPEDTPITEDNIKDIFSEFGRLASSAELIRSERDTLMHAVRTLFLAVEERPADPNLDAAQAASFLGDAADSVVRIRKIYNKAFGEGEWDPDKETDPQLEQLEQWVVKHARK